jgi:hypothetical protein
MTYSRSTVGGSLCDILLVGTYMCEHASFSFFQYPIMYTFMLAPHMTKILEPTAKVKQHNGSDGT